MSKTTGGGDIPPPTHSADPFYDGRMCDDGSPCMAPNCPCAERRPKITLELAGDSWANERKHYRDALAYIELMLRRRETTRDTALAGVAKVALAKWQNDHD